MKFKIINKYNWRGWNHWNSLFPFSVVLFPTKTFFFSCSSYFSCLRSSATGIYTTKRDLRKKNLTLKMKRDLPRQNWKWEPNRVLYILSLSISICAFTVYIDIYVCVCVIFFLTFERRRETRICHFFSWQAWLDTRVDAFDLRSPEL